MRCAPRLFNKLVKIVCPSISKLKMNQRETVSPGEQLGITLRQVLLLSWVKYIKIFKKMIDFYRYLLEIF